MSLMRIDEIFSFEKGVLQSSKCVPGEFDFITASSDWKTHNEYSHDCEALIFAAAASGSLGRTHYVNGKFVSSDLCFIITPKDQKKLPVDLKFYHILFNELKNEIVRNTKAGTSKEAIGLGSFGKYELPYFDIDTQIEIKNRFVNSEEIKSSLSTELNQQVSLVKKLRQQLLQDAVQGKLVEQNKKDEPASELLKKIKAEKAKLIAEKKLKKEKELSPIKPEEIPFEIPENWVWYRLGDLCIELLGGYAFDSTRYSKTETQNQVIRLGNVKPNQLVLETTPVFIDDDYAKEALRASLFEGDILITMTGTRAKKDYLFSLCLTETDLQTKNLFLNQRVGCFRFGLFIVNSYINVALKDVRLLNAVFESSTGAANQANIGIAALKDILIPLPPLAEQNRIVQKLDELMQYCNALEESIKQSESQNEKLLQQVLREALRKEPVEA
jgi:type I restriction enzyme S subunit